MGELYDKLSCIEAGHKGFVCKTCHEQKVSALEKEKAELVYQKKGLLLTVHYALAYFKIDGQNLEKIKEIEDNLAKLEGGKQGGGTV